LKKNAASNQGDYNESRKERRSGHTGISHAQPARTKLRHPNGGGKCLSFTKKPEEGSLETIIGGNKEGPNSDAGGEEK